MAPYFAHDIRVIRPPRHGASCPAGLGVSCSADRNVLAKTDEKGLWLEELERHPEALLPACMEGKEHAGLVKVDLNRPMVEILAELRCGRSTSSTSPRSFFQKIA
jgi:fumarate hydratase class I